MLVVSNENNDIDAFEDAYEYLISNYASIVGKSGGEFFTPQNSVKAFGKACNGRKNKH